MAAPKLVPAVLVGNPNENAGVVPVVPPRLNAVDAGVAAGAPKLRPKLG